MSERKTISNSFVVTTLLDGESAPYYFQEWFAWSNDSTTASVTTAPTIAGSWATSIPAQGNYSYLWRKSIRYVWNDNTRQYTTETPQYFRMSGTNGTSINIRGQVANASSRGNGTATIITDSGTQTITLSDGDAVTQLDNGHLYQWVTEGGGKWLDLGQFKGESGVTYYTHIAWATNVIYSGSAVTSVEGFVTTKSPNDTTHIWMGVLVDENSGQDSANATTYTWSNTKGNKGNDGKNAGEVILTPSTIFFNGDQGGYVYDTEYIQVGVGMKVDGQSCAISDISVGDTPKYVSYTLSGTTITFRNTGADYGYIEGSVSIVVTGTMTSGGIATTYIATGVLSIVCTHAGETAENAFVVDLENEMTNVALDENGDLIADFDMYFKVRAYYGTTNVLSDSACSVSASCSDPDVTVTDTNAKTTGIRVQISNGTHLLDTTEVSVTVTHTTYGTRTVIFTLAGVCGGENAVLQELLPSLDAISFARTAAGGLTPSSRDLTLSIKKTQGGSTSTQSISDSGLTIRWSSTSMPASKTGGNGWGNGTATGISWNNTTMQIANTVEATNIYIAAFNSDGTLVDRETIPVIKDGNNGAKGDDGVSYCIVFTKAAARVDENDIVTAELAGYAYKYVGGVRSALTSTTIRYGYILTDYDTYAETTTDSNGFFDAGTWFNGDDITDYEQNSPSIFAAIIIGGNPVHAEMITISVKGNTGSRGKTGRFYYYAQEWSDDSSISYAVTDAEAPYFFYNNNYWVFNPTSNGNYTMHQMGTPSDSSANWKLMVTDFKFIITEAIFGSYAHFGSAIINGDWLLSTNGKIGITDYNNGSSISGTLIGGTSFSTIAYTLFDPQNPLGKDITVRNGTTDVTIATSETTHTLGTVDLVFGTTYQITCKGKRNGSTGIYVRVRNNSYGTKQLIYYPSTTEGEYSAFFRVTTSATYTVEMYQPTTGGGGVTSMWSIDKVVFSPNYAVDLLTGAVIQYEAYMQGFIKKSKTIINSSNINKYAYKSIFDDMVLDFDKCGNFIELQYQGSIYFALPMLSSYLAPKYTEDQKTQIRSFIGSNMIIYNKTGSELTVVYKLLETSTYATAVVNNGFIELECHTDIDINSKEVVFWEIVKKGTMV